MERVRRSRTELHRRGTAAGRGKTQEGGRVWIGSVRPGGPEAGCFGRRLQDGHPGLVDQDGAVVGEEMIERGREQFGEQLARSRSAGREGTGTTTASPPV